MQLFIGLIWILPARALTLAVAPRQGQQQQQPAPHGRAQGCGSQQLKQKLLNTYQTTVASRRA